MKFNILAISSVLAAIAPLAILPVSAAAAGIAFTVIGVLAVFAADYGRTIVPHRRPAQVIAFGSNYRMPAGLSEAA